MSRVIGCKDIKGIGIQLANIHNQPILMDLRSSMFLNGHYLYEKSCKLNMSLHVEIKDAVQKIDAIIQKVTNTLPNPFVMLWNGGDENKEQMKYIYGNPAWDLGIILNNLSDCKENEKFLHQYLTHQGVPVTIIELYAGILYAKLHESLINHDEIEWQRLAQNECASILHGNELVFREVSAETLARLGLTGLNR
jgi:hypothetical protein